ncbi:MAG TPA: hypothetical protein VIR03_00935 [Candidatus Saccharimonadales bacterium]
MHPYPQDEQQQPPNQNQMGPAPMPFNYGHPVGSPKKKVNWLPWIICGVLLLVIIISGVAYVASRDAAGSNDKNTVGNASDTANNSAVAGSNTTTANACPGQQKQYTNKSVQVQFCYPAAWGSVAVANGQFDPSDSGTRSLITFSGQPAVHLGLASTDWSTDTGKAPSCQNPSVQKFPDTTNFSPKWATQGTGSQISSALRGLEVVPDSYLMQEEVSAALGGVCLEGYMATGSTVYPDVEATFYAVFGGKITTSAAHINSPTTLISVADRTNFTNFVKSIAKY